LFSPSGLVSSLTRLLILFVVDALIVGSELDVAYTLLDFDFYAGLFVEE